MQVGEFNRISDGFPRTWRCPTIRLRAARQRRSSHSSNEAGMAIRALCTGWGVSLDWSRTSFHVKSLSSSLPTDHGSRYTLYPHCAVRSVHGRTCLLKFVAATDDVVRGSSVLRV
jgi:hypothetical protein